MANLPISSAAALTGAGTASGDLFPLLDVSASAGAQGSKITRDELAAAMVIAMQRATASVDGLATAAQITKLDGIEAAADVTDATNVAAAGAVMAGGALGTPSSGTLSGCSGLPVSGITASTSTALGVGSLEIGHASDTTLARSSAGNLTVEGNLLYRAGGSFVGMPWERCIALSDESTTDITASTSVPKVSFYAPFALTLTGLLGTLSVAGTGSAVIMDVHVAGTSVMSTNKISIDASELTSDTAATPPGITTTSVAALALVELFIDQKGATIAGKGAKIQIYATRA